MMDTKQEELTPMPSSTLYAVLLALVLGVGWASTAKDTIETAQKAFYEGDRELSTGLE